MIEARYHDEVNVLQELFEDSSLAKPRAPFDRASWYALLAEAGYPDLVFEPAKVAEPA